MPLPQYRAPFPPRTEVRVTRVSKFLAALFALGAIYSFWYSAAGLADSNIAEYYSITPDLVSAFDPVFILLGLALGVFLVELLFILAVWRAKRWTIPVTALFIGFAALELYVGVGYLNWVILAAIALLFVLLPVVLVSLMIKWRAYMQGPARKLWLQIPLFLLFSVFFTVALLPHLFPDDSVVHDADLQLPYVEPLAEADNAYYALVAGEELWGPDASASDIAQQTSEYFKQYTDGVLDMTDVDFQTYLEATTVYSDAFSTAAQRSGYQCPQTLNQYDMTIELCSLGHIRVMNQINILQGKAALERGDETFWLNATTDSLQVAQMVASSKPTYLITVLVAVANYGAVFDGVEQTLGQYELSTSTQNTLTTKLAEQSMSGELFAEFYRVKYLEFKNLLTSALPNPDERVNFINYYYHPNATLNEGAAWARDFAESFSEQDYCDLILATPGASGEPVNSDSIDWQEELYDDGSLLSLVSPNLIGRVLLDVYWYSIVIIDTHCTHNERLDELIVRLQPNESL